MNQAVIQYCHDILHQLHYYRLVSMAVGIACLEFVLAYYLNYFVSAITTQSLTKFIVIGGGLAFIGVLIGIIQRQIKISEGMLQLSIENSITNTVFQSSLSQPADAVLSKPLGSWLSLNNSDAPIISHSLAVSLTDFISGAASFLAAFIFGILISPWLTLIILTLGLVSLLIPKLTGKWILTTQQQRQTDQDTMQTTLLQIFDAKILLHTLHAERFAQNLFSNKYKKFTQSQLENARSQHLIESISVGAGFLFDVTSLVISLTFVAKNQITIGQFMGFNVLNSSFTWIFYTMPGLYNQLLRASVSAKRLLSFGTTSEIAKQAPNHPSEIKALQLSHLSFKYGQETSWVLKDVNLDWQLTPQTKIILTGPSGSGKTTFLKLLLGFQQPNKGSLHYLDNSRTPFAPGEVKLSYVPQQVRLFSLTIRENILLGRSITSQQYQKVLKQTDLWDFIESLPKKDETKILSSNAGNLSSGQIQKIGVARALVQNTSFILFDEPTANLDDQSANDFERTIKELPVAAIMITHRAMQDTSQMRHYEIEDGTIELKQ